jgi:type IV fimbrial biogenesis protein FimT
MSLVLLGVSLALALPSYRNMIEKRQVTNGAEQLAAFINSVQGAAVKTNRQVNLSYTRTNNDVWCIGAIDRVQKCDCTLTNDSDDDYCKVGSQSFILNNEHADNRDLLHSINGESEYLFDFVRGLVVLPDGSVMPPDAPLSMELRSDSGDFRLNLMVNNTGRVILCSGSNGHAVPGYDACPESGAVVSDPDPEIDPGIVILPTDPILEPGLEPGPVEY